MKKLLKLGLVGWAGIGTNVVSCLYRDNKGVYVYGEVHMDSRGKNVRKEFCTFKDIPSHIMEMEFGFYSPDFRGGQHTNEDYSSE